jgi:prephenate dehydrogenase
MTVNITIVGLGQIGGSIGLALNEHTNLVHRTGHDLELSIARQAKKMEAVDKVAVNLPSAVREADLVLLCLPMDQIRETLGLIAPDLKEEAVVMDTGPVKEVVAAWASEILPAGCHYVGLTPVINPIYLHASDSGIEAAHADLFRDGMIAIVAPARTASEAIKLAADLTRLLGADPLFVDPLEIDSLMAATHILPQLLAATLLNATIDQPGWREGRKVAGRAYAEVTAPVTHMSEPRALGSSAMLSKENVLRAVDGVIAGLQTLRTDLENEDGPAMEKRLERAYQARLKWWSQRQEANWAVEDFPSAGSPSASDFFGRFLGFGRKNKDNDN